MCGHVRNSDTRQHTQSMHYAATGYPEVLQMHKILHSFLTSFIVFSNLAIIRRTVDNFDHIVSASCCLVNASCWKLLTSYNNTKTMKQSAEIFSQHFERTKFLHHISYTVLQAMQLNWTSMWTAGLKPT